ncbi:MAG TPA: fluoride efflux transporter CrcB [Nitrososphaeraceae archaeon]|nr:fluoride efflux transporter CrcB [Nitrososphaeraceae archaeon]
MKGFEFLLLGIGAICGAFLRYKIVESPLVVLGGLPLNVLIVNIIGSFILGIFSVLSVTWNLDPRYSFLFAIGFCGSLTTMSSFALEVNNLLDNKQFAFATINIFTNIGLSIASVLGGRVLASLFV